MARRLAVLHTHVAAGGGTAGTADDSLGAAAAGAADQRSAGAAGGGDPSFRRDVLPRLSRCSGPADLTTSAHRKRLEPDDIQFFRTHGFLIKKRLLDPQKLRVAVANVWDALEGVSPRFVEGSVDTFGTPLTDEHMHAPSAGIARDDPRTRTGSTREACARSGRRTGWSISSRTI
jgi:hypothetical protein